MTSYNSENRAPLQGQTEQQPTFEEFLHRVNTVIGDALANGDVNMENIELVELLEILASARIDGECPVLGDGADIGDVSERVSATPRLQRFDLPEQMSKDVFGQEGFVIGHDGELVIMDMEPVEITVRCPNPYIALEVSELIDAYFEGGDEDPEEDTGCGDGSCQRSCPRCGRRPR